MTLAVEDSVKSECPPVMGVDRSVCPDLKGCRLTEGVLQQRKEANL